MDITLNERNDPSEDEADELSIYSHAVVAGPEAPVSRPLRVLIVAEKTEDASAIRASLETSGYDPVCAHVRGAAGLETALRGQFWDVIIAQSLLPDFSAFATLVLMKAERLEIPVVVVADSPDGDLGVQTVLAGALEYLPRQEIGRLGTAVTRAMRVAHASDERRRETEWLRGRVDELARREADYRLMMENSSDIVHIFESDGTVRYISPSVSHILGYDPEEMVGRSPLEFIHPEDRDRYRTVLQSILSTSGPAAPFEFRLRHRDGSWRHMESIGNNLLHQPGVGGVIVNSRDITERKHTEIAFQWQAHHDALTHLPNRVLFQDRLEEALRRSERHGDAVAVLFFDLDHFKRINDTLGHAIGDDLLREVARRVSACVRAEDTVARMGGDEFTVLLTSVSGASSAVNVAQRILDTLSRPLQLGGHELYVSASIGISLFPGDGEDAATLLRNADLAMYRSKEQGRGMYRLYTESMNAAAFERLLLETNLRKAVERDELILHYQPQIELAGGKVTGAEALLRWRHPTLGLISPDKFIPLAEETGLILPIGEWALQQACREARRWPETNGPMRVCVNLSARQFSHRGLVESVRIALEETGLEPERLDLELTETALMETGETAARILHDLRALGVRLSVDDFGTGYSSLAYLRRFPLDVLKVDEVFVKGLDAQGEDRAVVRAIIEMAHALGLEAVAEGVETDVQRRELERLGCDGMQGYLFSQPLSAEGLEELLLVRPTTDGLRL